MCNIAIFCYGTLQRNCGNHQFCRNSVSIEPATVCGRLYQLSVGYPALLVPTENILKIGTNSPSKDARTQYDLNSNRIDFHAPGGWYEVHGELVTFSDPEFSLPPIDRLEGVPCYYQRVLIPARREKGGITTAWVYIMNRVPCGSTLLKNGRWNPSH